MDEEFNPLVQYDDLEANKSLELANKQVVSASLFTSLVEHSSTDLNRNGSPPAKHNM